MLTQRYLDSSLLPIFFAPDTGTGGDGGDVPAPDDPQETPGQEGGPGTGTPADPQSDHDYEQRYNDLRSEFDRRNQEYSEADRLQSALSGAAGPEAQAEALKRFGVELQDDARNEPEVDPDPDERLDHIETRLEERERVEQEQQWAQAEQTFLTEGIEILEGHEDREFSEQEINALVSIARANPTEQGLPDLNFAHEQYNALLKERREAWTETKKAPRRPGTGVPAIEQVDLDNDDERVGYMAQKFAEARQSDST